MILINLCSLLQTSSCNIISRLISCPYCKCTTHTLVPLLLYLYNNDILLYYSLNERSEGDDTGEYIESEIYTLDLLNIPRKRSNRDKVKNGYGKTMLDFCKGCNRRRTDIHKCLSRQTCQQ
jgi:hypothetical protein